MGSSHDGSMGFGSCVYMVFGAVGIPHPEKAAKGGEDAFFYDDSRGRVWLNEINTLKGNVISWETFQDLSDKNKILGLSIS